MIQACYHSKYKGLTQRRINSEGFGLTEALIAGVILLFTMTSIGRFTQAAMTSGSNQEIRNKIESKIMDNIQEIQQQDSRITWETIKQLDDEQVACNKPAEYTKNKLETTGSGYFVASPQDVIREISKSPTAPEVMVIKYSFDGPEHSVGTETRIIELNPTFAADCIDLGNST